MNATSGNSTLIGIFRDRTQAQEAINELRRAGFRDDQIGVTTREGKIERASTDDDDGDTYAAEGAAAGLAAGASVGALWGIGIVSGLLPAIGPAIAGGTLAAILSSAAAGAAATGLAGALVGLGFSREEAEFYETEFKAGRTIVTVRAGTRAAEALDIIRRFGGYERSTMTEGTQSMQGASAACNTACSSETAKGAKTVQATEEQLHVNKERQQVGEVKVRKEVHTEHKTIDVPVEREEVVIERHAAGGRPVTGGSVLAEGQEIRVPVSEEHVEVTKTPVVKEEVTIGKRKVQGKERVSEDLRKEEIKIEKEGNARVKDNRR